MVRFYTIECMEITERDGRTKTYIRTTDAEEKLRKAGIAPQKVFVKRNVFDFVSVLATDEVAMTALAAQLEGIEKPVVFDLCTNIGEILDKKSLYKGSFFGGRDWSATVAVVDDIYRVFVTNSPR